MFELHANTVLEKNSMSFILDYVFYLACLFSLSFTVLKCLGCMEIL